MYVLIDSNNFFVACERLFRPDLQATPTVVLSSNDGCAVSRSAEAKALGVAMGEPLHKLRERFLVLEPKSTRTHPKSLTQPAPGNKPILMAFSANFELYGDISERITTLLCSITPRIELYSVDEAFLDLSELDIPDYAAWGRAVRAQILRNIGIPVSVGIAPSKTLCKLANHWAKKHPETGGVHYIDRSQPDTTLEQAARDILGATPVSDIWGVGWRLAPKLRADGIYTALDMAGLRPQRAQQLMGVQGRRMVMELSGTSCLPLNAATAPQHMIARGRQFGRDARDLATLSAAVTTLATRACAELRREKQRAYAASVYLSTNRHKPNYHSAFLTVPFAAPTSDTGQICRALVDVLHQADDDIGYTYHKAEVVLHRLTTTETTQSDLFGEVDFKHLERSDQRMHALDTIRAKHGSRALMYASETLSDAWKPRKHLSSPRYTSAWTDLPEARLTPLEHQI